MNANAGQKVGDQCRIIHSDGPGFLTTAGTMQPVFVDEVGRFWRSIGNTMTCIFDPRAPARDMRRHVAGTNIHDAGTNLCDEAAGSGG